MEAIDIKKCYGVGRKPYSKLTKQGKIFSAMIAGNTLTASEANRVANTTEGTRYLRWIREDHGHFIQKTHRNADNTGTYLSYKFEPEYAKALRDAIREAKKTEGC